LKEERLGLSRAGDRLTNVADQTIDQRLIVRFPEVLIGLSRPQTSNIIVGRFGVSLSNCLPR
jgi:hypothetical protein